jgi:hypothetical protein
MRILAAPGRTRRQVAEAKMRIAACFRKIFWRFERKKSILSLSSKSQKTSAWHDGNAFEGMVQSSAVHGFRLWRMSKA